MKFFLVFFLHVALLFASSYNFDEIKYIKAVDSEFINSGKIFIDGTKVVISYKDREIIKQGDEIKIVTSNKKVTHLKDKVKYFTGLMIDTMVTLGEYNRLMREDSFKKEIEKNLIYINFRGDLKNLVTKAIVKVKDNKVVEFEMFMPNEDRLKIVKK